MTESSAFWDINRDDGFVLTSFMVLVYCRQSCVLSVVWLRSSLICGGACRFIDDGLSLEESGVEG